jgi:CheY-like chemotaxis protein
MNDQRSEGPPLKVLVVEDIEAHYEAALEAVERLPCPVEVTWARDYDSAYEYLISDYFSIVLLDLVLDTRYETDIERWEGLWLLSDILDFQIEGSRAVVVYTSFPDPMVERNALRNYNVTDFLKKGSTDELAGELLALCEKENFFGVRCEVYFGGELSWESMVEACTRRESQALTARMSKDLARTELEGLFRREFNNCRAITIQPMAEGHSGSGIARVEREFLDGSKGSDVVVKFGDVELIRREISGWQAIKDFLFAARATEVLDHALGIGLGLLSYRFLGAPGEQPESFRGFFAEAGAEEIGDAIDGVFKEVCRLWYADENRKAAERLRLDETYRRMMGIDIERVAKGYEFRFGVAARERAVVSYPELGHDLPHLIDILRRDALSVVTDTWCCRTHGDLHIDNLLVTSDGTACWLIDFGWSGRGHWARDFAVLETSIRFQLLSNSDLAQLYEFESLMARTSKLGAPEDLAIIRDASTRKAGIAIQRLRAAAASVIEPYPAERALAEYFLALVFASAKYLEFHRLLDTRWRKRHVMIAAGVLIERLQSDLIPAGLLERVDSARGRS